MNYIKQLNAYWRWRELNDATPSQTELYFALLDYFNRFAWAESLCIPAIKLMGKIGIANDKQLRRDRDALVECGLIEYEPGTRQKAGTYKLVLLYDGEEMSDSLSDNLSAKNEKTDEKEGENVRQTVRINKKEKENEKENENKDILSCESAPTTNNCQDVLDAYNELCPSLPTATKLSDKRIKQIKSRLKTYSVDQLKEAFIAAEQSDFLTGRSSDWRANLDWFIANDDNILKTLEGKYENNVRQSVRQTVRQDDPYIVHNEGTKNVADIEKMFMAAYS